MEGIESTNPIESCKLFPTLDEIEDCYGGCPWTVLGEVGQPNMWPMRPVFNVKDKSGRDFLVAFYVDDVKSINWTKIKKGMTLAIRYPVFHYFMDGQQGIRVEETPSVKLIPFSLKEITKMGEILGKSKAKATKGICSVCGKAEAKQKCGACSIPYYCSKECQKKDWKGEHKELCKYMRSSDFKDLFRPYLLSLKKSGSSDEAVWWKNDLTKQLKK
eukprot:TRINITY_DN3111_c1_g1_i1.p1 TRINITY_DN3111_c1_g1~~TRINITY_DN3111_c1_g1_i1.p1  ORF type:complete len:216 (-),score=41.77 TRINITY_DN3111_c1_g1_i1:254-901(-)